MTIEDYLKIIKNLEVKFNEENTEEILSAIELLENIKPVRLPLEVLREKLLLSKGVNRNVQTQNISKVLYYPSYEGMCQWLQLKEDIARGIDEAEALRLRFVREYLEGNVDKLQAYNTKLEQYYKAFLQDEERGVWAPFLAHFVYSVDKHVSYYIIQRYTNLLNGIDNIQLERKWIEDGINMGILKEGLDAGGQTYIIIIRYREEEIECQTLAKMLSNMGNTVFVISLSEKIDVDDAIEIEDTVSISIENAYQQYGCIVIPSIEIIYNNISLGSNVANLLNYICKNETVDDYAVLLANSDTIEELKRTQVTKQRIHILRTYQVDISTRYISMACAGDYLSYMSRVYLMDVKAAIEREPVCKFSIVLPARNSAKTLRYTLMTCLNQRYTDDYEIVVCDNSTGSNTQVYDLCQELNDRRIKYYKAPRDLRLAKSFEYAMLQARGKYIFSLGSDDGVLPWALEAWEEITRKYPENEVFIWDRGFYAWEGFNGGQQNQFVIPRRYQKGQYNEKYEEGLRYVARAIKVPSDMYLMPMMYINSGFKRSFFKTILERTGRLWDGICQDIYIGVIASIISPQVLYIPYPFTIAGMSQGSIGADSNIPTDKLEKVNARKQEELKSANVGGFALSKTENLFPEVTTDVSSLYNSVLRAVDFELLPREFLTDGFEWKEWFLHVYKTLTKREAYYDRKIHQLRWAAEKQGEEFLKWFDETIYEDALKPAIYDEKRLEEHRQKKTYIEEEDENGAITLDASKYGVKNIYDAAILFEKITGL